MRKALIIQIEMQLRGKMENILYQGRLSCDKQIFAGEFALTILV